jgi:hypothetical protein
MKKILFLLLSISIVNHADAYDYAYRFVHGYQAIPSIVKKVFVGITVTTTVAATLIIPQCKNCVCTYTSSIITGVGLSIGIGTFWIRQLVQYYTINEEIDNILYGPTQQEDSSSDNETI